MFFGKKKQQEASEIKQAVGTLTTPPIQKEAEIKEEIKELPPLPDIKTIELAPLPERPKAAPLFVKVERYSLILSKIKKIRNILASTKKLIEIRKKIDKLKEDSDTILEKNLSQIIDDMQALDVEFVRPEFKPPTPQPEQNLDYMEKYVNELREELSILQNEVEKLKV
ncbi:MAG: hypothetical protein QXO19_01340 [Candidatus Aenigmatarchaeota archaeon]